MSALEQLKALAQQKAILAKADGHLDRERVWMHVLALVEQAEAEIQHRAADHLSAYGQLLEQAHTLTVERDRARDVAVALEQQLAQVRDILHAGRHAEVARRALAVIDRGA